MRVNITNIVYCMTQIAIVFTKHQLTVIMPLANRTEKVMLWFSLSNKPSSRLLVTWTLKTLALIAAFLIWAYRWYWFLSPGLFQFARKAFLVKRSNLSTSSEVLNNLTIYDTKASFLLPSVLILYSHIYDTYFETCNLSCSNAILIWGPAICKIFTLCTEKVVYGHVLKFISVLCSFQ